MLGVYSEHRRTGLKCQELRIPAEQGKEHRPCQSTCVVVVVVVVWRASKLLGGRENLFLWRNELM